MLFFLQDYVQQKRDDGKKEDINKACIRKETPTVKFVVCPELAQDLILCADFLCNAEAALSFAEGTLITQ